MNYIEELCKVRPQGDKVSKEVVKEYLEKTGNREKAFKVINVVGTSGKGSTASMITKGLLEAGHSVGMLTSPHLLRVNERIQVNGKPIDNKGLERLIAKLFKELPQGSFSEYLTLIAVEYFLEKNVEYVVLEAFVGGKLDPTNNFDTIATVLTSIGLDHQKLLGDTIEKILKDKLGMLTSNAPLFTRVEHPLVSEEARRIGSELCQVTRIEKTNLKGEFQRENAGLAYELLVYLGVDEGIIQNALMKVSWPGRAQFIRENVLLDCAHNPLALSKLGIYIESLGKKRVFVLFALSRNKDFSEFEPLLSFAHECYFTKPAIFKALDPKEYTTNNIIENPVEAFREIYRKLEKDDLLLVTGSVFLVSDVLEAFENNTLFI